MWAEKEARNLSRMHEAGIRCPKPLLLRNHVLAMTFIGRDSKVGAVAAQSTPAIFSLAQMFALIPFSRRRPDCAMQP